MLKNIYYRFSLYKDLFIGALKPDTYRCMSNCDVLLCCHDVDRGDTINGKAYSKLIDSVFDDLKNKGWICNQFAYPPAFFVGNKAWGNPVSANRRFLLVRALSVMCKLVSMISLVRNVQVINKEPKMDELYGELLDACKPSCIIAIGSPAALCRVAKIRKIPVYELLHGIGYSYVPWGWDQEAGINLPDGILSLDAISARTFLSLTSKHIKVIKIPHPFFRRFDNKDDYQRLPSEWQVRPVWIPKNMKIVIYSISWGYDGDHGNCTQIKDILSNGIIHEELLNVIEETKSEVFWLLRLHPVQLRSRKYNHQKQYLNHLLRNNPNCEWEKSSVLPLPLLLKYSDGHISMSSMTAYDAAFMGVKSLMLCPTLINDGINATMFADLRETGFVELCGFCFKSIKKWVLGVQRADKPFASDSSNDDWNDAVKCMLGRVYKELLIKEV